MTFETVVPELLATFPELKPICDEEFDYYGDQPLDPYPVFAAVLRPAAYAALDKGDEAFAKRAFAFYERVAAEPDDQVNSLTHIELIEQLANDKRRLPIAWGYMGQYTKQAARDYARAVKRQVGRDIALPE